VRFQMLTPLLQPLRRLPDVSGVRNEGMNPVVGFW
jgi:hypothetical protein